MPRAIAVALQTLAKHFGFRPQILNAVAITKMWVLREVAATGVIAGPEGDGLHACVHGHVYRHVCRHVMGMHMCIDMCVDI